MTQVTDRLQLQLQESSFLLMERHFPTQQALHKMEQEILFLKVILEALLETAVQPLLIQFN